MVEARIHGSDASSRRSGCSSLTEQLDLVAFGDLAVDLYFNVETLPAPGGKVAAAFLGGFPGGMGANVAAAAASTGLRCAVVSRVGPDYWGEALRAEVTVHGVSAAWVTSDDSPTDRTVIQLLPNGERSALVAVREGGRTDLVEQVLDAAPRLVYLAPCMLDDALYLAAECQRRSIPVATDLEPYAFAQNAATASGLVIRSDLVVANRAIAARLPRRRRQQVRMVLCGAGGLWVEADGGRWQGDARTDLQVVDTTGAGDAATGAACAAFLQERDAYGIGTQALRAASKCVTRLGARGSNRLDKD